MSLTNLACRNLPPTVFHFLFLICYLDGGTLDDLDRFGLKVVKPVLA